MLSKTTIASPVAVLKLTTEFFKSELLNLSILSKNVSLFLKLYQPSNDDIERTRLILGSL